MEEKQARVKIAAAVILYHPDQAVLSNIKSYYAFVDKIYLFDNTEKSTLEIDWAQFDKVEYHQDGKNCGISERLNAAAAKAIADGFSWLLTMDQDSKFSEYTITQYLHCFNTYTGKEKVGLFGPVFYSKEQQVTPDCSWRKAERIITSGTLLNLNAFKKIGGFDEALFIDSVDHDYCIKVKLAGYEIIEFLSVVMVHKLGTLVNRASIKTLFLVKKSKEVHSPLRCYYMLRNYLYLREKYKNQDVPLMNIIRKDVKDRINKALFYGRNSAELIRFLLLAYRHYKKKTMGKFDADTAV